jgi:ABC-type sugar transport system substrate-binding protein
MTRKIYSAVFALGMFSAVALPMFGVGSAAAAPNGNANPNASAGKVTICHKTSSATNPFVEITISANGMNGHDDHHDGGDVAGGGGEGCFID